MAVVMSVVMSVVSLGAMAVSFAAPHDNALHAGISWIDYRDTTAKTLMDRSMPYVGVNHIQSEGYSGEGVRIAIIDTGVDFAHPDLKDGPGVRGHDFVGTGRATDVNGHGTQVAGIIAANGSLVGVAPDAVILSYRVSVDGNAVSTDLITQAIRRAVQDGADVINISLGINRTNVQIESAVSEAVKSGILVVLAAGNDGPGRDTISSPGRNADAITVGATYNNITSSMVATLRVGDKQYQALPMVGIEETQQTVSGKLVFGKYGRAADLLDNYAGAVLLVERGSDVQNQLVYFAEKEYNAARAGASAVIVYNNKPGLYLGDVSSSLTIQNYTPSIPILSISQEDGMELRQEVAKGPEARLDVFYNPDYVGHFSSRGPVSPFYIKPDLVAPGIFVNSTHIGGAYNLSSGTSFAAPHVAGAAALLLEKNPSLTPGQIKSLLVTTTAPIVDAYGNSISVFDAGAGRLDVKNAFEAGLVLEPAFIIMTFSPAETVQEGHVSMHHIGGKEPGAIDIDVESPEFINTTYKTEDSKIIIRSSIADADFGIYEGVARITHENTTYRIPIIFEHVSGSVDVHDSDGMLGFKITNPPDWHYAKIVATDAQTGASKTVSVTPRQDSQMRVDRPGTYWIESIIRTDNITHLAHDTVYVPVASTAVFEPPGQAVIIVAAITTLVGLVGLAYRRGQKQDTDSAKGSGEIG